MISENIQTIIRARSSWRTYLNTPIEGFIREKIENYLAKNELGPFGSKMRFKILDATKDNRSEKKKYGTYGFISGAMHFLVGAVEKNHSMNLEDYGYVFEKIILYATSLNLGTCWLGGTFNKSGFREKLNLLENETLPAISPIGNIPEKRRIVGSIIRTAIGAKKRKPWEELFFKDNFSTPITKESAGIYDEAFEMVRLGPSATNGQAWRLVYEESKEIIHFYVQKSKKYKTNDRIPGFNRLDIGIAMCHFELTMNEKKIHGKWVVDEPKQIKTEENGPIYICSWKKE